MAFYPWLDELLRSWLESERQNFVTAAQAQGLPLTINLVRTMGELTSDGVSYHQEPYTTSVANHVLIMSDILRSLPYSAEPIARQIVENFGASCAPYQHQREFQTDRVRWVGGHVLSWCRDEYLRRLRNPGLPDIALINLLADEVESYLVAPTLDQVTSLPVAGLEPAGGKVEFGPLCLRQLDAEELGRIAGPISLSGMTRRGIWPFNPWVSETATLVLRQRFQRDQPRPVDRYLAKLLLAVQLRGFEPHGRGLGYQWTEPGPELLYGATAFRLPSHGEARPVTTDDLRLCVELAERIPDEAVARPRSAAHVGLHRFSLGAARENQEDGLIDYVIALESILLPDNEAELSFRFRIFGAKYLSTSTETPWAIYKQLKNLYQLRSRLVHSSRFPDASDVAKALPIARALASRALIRCLEQQKWPSTRDFEDAALA